MTDDVQGELLGARAGEFGNAPAISCPGCRSPLTYASLADFVGRTGAALATLDLKPGDELGIGVPRLFRPLQADQRAARAGCRPRTES